ncbi:Mth938-like domain-containing protein [Methylocystis iwaonis]|uniref:Mth938-like domain-containing protein n=1 Tax=Methylocystis iwaonis TaxID=2885079 RepID=UPI002E7AD128|nr:Mth938-like domain-containing protein [Methylocystis iwaonis]
MTDPQGYVPGRYKIDDYGNGGFRFADMSHRGSILALPTGIRAITPSAWNEIDAATIDLALSDSGELDLFIVGTGKDLMPLASTLRAKLRDAGIGCETMATGAAVRTYNMLIDEGRQVGALLIAV